MYGLMSNLSGVARIVRDYVYDETVSPGAHSLTGVNVNDVLSGLNAIRGTTTSYGSVARILKRLTAQGLLILDDKVRPGVYRWNTTEPCPVDYRKRPPLTTTTTATTTQVAAAVQKGQQPMAELTEAEKRNKLRAKLQERMDEITGEAEKKEQKEQVPVAKKDAHKGITRRNGQVYQPRDLAGKSDVETLKQLRDKGIYPLLSGPPGTGKTVLVDATFGTGPGGLHTVTGDENTGVEDFVGQFSATGDPNRPYVWVDGPLVLALRSGGVLFIDDATLINPKVLAVCYPVMDGRGEIIVKQHPVNGEPEVVKAKPGFFVVAAHNPGVHGAILTDALASRFTARIWVETDLTLAASLGVSARFLKLVKILRNDKDQGQVNLWIPQLRELLAARDMASLFGEKVAAANLLGVCPEDDREWLQDKMNVVFNDQFHPFEIGEQL